MRVYLQDGNRRVVRGTVTNESLPSEGMSDLFVDLQPMSSSTVAAPENLLPDLVTDGKENDLVLAKAAERVKQSVDRNLGKRKKRIHDEIANDTAACEKMACC